MQLLTEWSHLETSQSASPTFNSHLKPKCSTLYLLYIYIYTHHIHVSIHTHANPETRCFIESTKSQRSSQKSQWQKKRPAKQIKIRILNKKAPFILLMAEILHHLWRMNPKKQWDKLPTSTGERRISVINSSGPHFFLGRLGGRFVGASNFTGPKNSFQRSELWRWRCSWRKRTAFFANRC